MLERFVKITMLTWIAVQGPASNQSVDKDYVMADKIIIASHDSEQTQKWIADSKLIHGIRYDYSKSTYTGIEKKIIITCRVHGDFQTTAGVHKSGYDCPKCGSVKAGRSRMRNCFERWLKHCTEFHSGKYGYSKVIYRGATKHVEIECPVHGVFKQSPSAHRRQGCRQCGNIVRNEKSNSLRNRAGKERFFRESPVIHKGKYDYSRSIYVNTKTQVEIICPVHGSIFQAPGDHLSGKGCNKCAKNNSDYSGERFVIDATEMHSGKYDYSKAVYTGCYDKVEIICPKHGSFWQAAIAHKRGQGCPTCSESRGEREVARWLRDNRIPFERQKRFESCKNKRSLPFDFHVPLFTLIEYDGAHHHDKEFSDRMGYDWEYRQKNDAIKTKWCEDNGYQLIRINKIDDIPSLGGALFRA